MKWSRTQDLTETRDMGRLSMDSEPGWDRMRGMHLGTERNRWVLDLEETAMIASAHQLFFYEGSP